MGHPSPLLIVAPGSSVSSHWPLSAGALAHAQPTRTRPSPIITSPSLSVRLSAVNPKTHVRTQTLVPESHSPKEPHGPANGCTKYEGPCLMSRAPSRYGTRPTTRDMGHDG
ncbi:hypothetical protein BKA56DRAFT_269270 [Ilyonectria sp. MPI-CAGE-AT-0026]|nr:hypothetical protein BKA56DRAFT_269270 [Ilyonectria sp. MPI-CAGE-AT-0026]